MNKLLKSEMVTNILWALFGIIGGLSSYSKEEYLICSVMFLIGTLYAFKTLQGLGKSKEKED